MFVVPPPPTYPQSARPTYNPTGAPLSTVTPTLETTNILYRPPGPEHHLVAGEGTYIVRDEIQLGVPAPHPSETPAPTLNNPLATEMPPPTAGTKLSFVRLPSAAADPPNGASPAKKKGPLYKLGGTGDHGNRLAVLQSLSLKEDPRETAHRSSGEGSTHSDKDSHTTSSTDPKVPAAHVAAVAAGSDIYAPPAPAFGEGNSSLVSSTTTATSASASNPPASFAAAKEAGSKRKKPKNDLKKTGSTFISRIALHDRHGSRLIERDEAGGGLMAFANINRCFNWLDLREGQPGNQKAEALFRIWTTKAQALCHDANQVTRSGGHVDVVIGYATGDLVWYECWGGRYSRLNKNGVINASPVSDVRWIPGSENLFLAAHTDGSLVVYDKEKEDVAFVPEDGSGKDDAHHHGHHQGQGEKGGESSRQRKGSTDSDTVLHVSKSVNSRNQKANPVACWKLSNHRINGIAFSPDCKHLAVVGEDGSLRIIDYLKEQLLDLYSSYYGGFTCCCFSPDGRYVLTGGQDDLVSIWSLHECRIVARCHGHHSWVAAVAFDPWRCDERNYRFGSVGEDCRLLLWDFSEGMLHRPKTMSVRHRTSFASQIGQNPPPSRQRDRAGSQSTNRLRSTSTLTSGEGLDDEDVVRHKVAPRGSVAKLPPVLSKVVGTSPLSGLGFLEEGIVTSSEDGHIRTWDRPKEGAKNGSQETISAMAKKA